MTALRDKSLRHIGASVAGFAVALQVMLSSLGLLLAANAAPLDAFGGHALCLAGGSGTTQPTAPVPAAPRHDHTGFCCLWHHLPGVQAAASLAPRPVAYARIAAGGRRLAAFIPGPRHRPANARAPPLLA
jgi:hypothetical protein